MPRGTWKPGSFRARMMQDCHARAEAVIKWIEDHPDCAQNQAYRRFRVTHKSFINALAARPDLLYRVHVISGRMSPATQAFVFLKKQR